MAQDDAGRGQARLRRDKGRDGMAEVLEGEVMDAGDPTDGLDLSQKEALKLVRKSPA